MKRIRYEQIHSMTNQYLKRRQCTNTDTAHKKECRWIQSLQEMALKRSVGGEATLENILSYSSISGDATVCEQQYTRLKNFIHDSVEPYKSELRKLLYPMFVHVYLELLCNGHKTPAHKFYGRHSGLFKDEEEYKPIMELLVKLYSRTDVLGCKEVEEFREHRFKICLSADAFSYLTRHLKTEDNMIMLQIFNQHIKVEVNTEESLDLELQEENISDDKKPASPQCIPDNKVIHNETEVSLSVLQQCIKRVREGAPCLSSICFFTFLNAYQGLCSVGMSPNDALLSAGFEDSTVKLWSVVPGRLKCEPPDVDVSRIQLGTSVYDTEEQDIRSVSDKEVATMKAHTGPVYKTCFTPDSKYLLSCSEDTTVRLWDLKTHSNVVCYQGHNYPVWDIDTSAIGGYFVTCSHDRTARLWCTDRTYPIRTFVGHTYDVDCVKFHPNCNYIATGSSDRSVRLWSIQESKSVRLMQGHRGSVLALAFAPGGQFLASAGDDRRIRIWDLGTGALFKELRGHTDTIHALSFNRDGTLLASGGLDCCIRIWDVRKGAASTCTSPTSSTEGHTSPELLGAFPTKSAVVIYLQFARYNLLRAAGPI